VRTPVGLRQVVVVDAIDAEGAFLHHALGRVHLAGTVRAGPGAQAAADAIALVDQNDAVLDPLVAGTRRADGDTGRILAMQAGFWEMHKLRGTLRGLHLVAVDAVEESARGGGAIGVLIAERGAVILGVPALAGDHAGVAADAGIEVDDKAELAGGGAGKGCHARPSRVLRRQDWGAARRHCLSDQWRDNGDTGIFAAR
jgi:hypothetical protein